jgi:membrane protein YqaA with SNARE-associated domain
VTEWVALYGAPGLFVAAFVGATLVPVSSEAAFVAAVAAGLPGGTALTWATAGNTLGCLLNYALGRWGGDAARARLGASRGGRAALRWIARAGGAALLGSWLPVVGDPLTVVAGAARIGLGWFLLAVPLLRFARYAALLGLFG